jgi:SEC-C motif
MGNRLKVGRNEPCPCGSTKKYKNCCMALPTPTAGVAAIGENPTKLVNGKQLPADALSDVLRDLQRAEVAQQQWTARYGHIRPHISIDYRGHKFVAAGGKLYFSGKNKWNCVSDFLFDYVPAVFGGEWFEAEKAKPEAERHVVFQWRAEGIRYMKAQPQQPDGSYAASVRSGPFAAYMAFAFNLFAIEDNSRFDDLLLRRLKNRDQFQGARHEVFVEATCLRAGFSIEHEDEKDRTRRHAEFTAKHKSTGQLLSIEAKSKHRPGVLGQKGVPNPPAKLSLRFGALLNDAIAKNPPHPLVVFIDTNLPFNAAERVLGRHPLNPYKPSPIMTALLDRDRKEHSGKDLYAMLVFTNHPHHYVACNETDPSKHVLAVVPNPPMGVQHPQALQALFQAANQYGNIPNEFPHR